MNKEKYIGEAALKDKPNKKLTLVIKDGSVTTPKIADKNVTTEKMADEAITTPKVAEQAITDSKLGDNAVVERTINEEAVTASKIASGAVETDKIADENVTNEKLAEDSVTTSKIKDESVTEDKLAELSVGTAKIKDGAVTKDKVANDSLTRDKLDPELRNTLDAAIGLPEDLIETIQNVDKTLKDHQSQLDDKQSQIDDKQQQITANDGDISLLQTRSTQMEEAIKSISASGGASQASAVTYENTESGLDSITAQSAIDELANKKFNKENIVQEFGESKDKVVSQFALPFRYIQNEEFIFAKVDAEDKLLFGIQWDGTPKFGKTSAVEDRLQSQVTLLAEKVATILGDGDTTNVIDTMNELKKFFADIRNTETLAGILTNLENVAKNLDKTTIKDEEGNVLDTPFRIIENEEFLKAIVDSDNKVLFGFYRATGEPYYPLNEMYHVIQNKEYFAAWLDADDKVVFGIRRDGEIIGEIHAVNALKQVISSLQEKVDTIDTSLQELFDVFSLHENPEYLAVEKDADGRVLSATYNDGSHYSHNLKSETIDTKVDKEEGKSLIDADVAIANTTIEDPEERSNMELDSENRVLSHRDKNGIKNENVGFNTPNYYKNGEKCEWIEESDVIPIVKKSDDIPLSILDGVSNHNTPNLIVPSDIQKTFNDGTHSFTPPNAGYEMSNRIECEAGDWFTRTGTATGMVVVTDSNDKNGQRLFNPNGTTLGSTFQIPKELTWVRYIRMAVDAAAAKSGEVAICKGKNAYNGEQKGNFLTIEKLRVTSSNMPKDLKFIKASNGDYYELYIDDSDFSVKARKIDPSVITELPDDFPAYNCSGDFSKYFKSWVTMSNGYLVERNQNGVTNFLKLAANAYYYAEFRKETTLGGIPRYVAMFPYSSYTGINGERGLTIYDKDFGVVDTDIRTSDMTPDAHDFVYIDDNHVIVVGYKETKSVTITQGSESLSILSPSLYISEIKKINGRWIEIASFDCNDYPQLLTDGINEGFYRTRLHWNTIQLDYDGNLLINMRDMNCFWKIKRTVDSSGNITIGSKTKDYNEAVIGRVGGVYNSAYINNKRVLDDGFQFTDIPSSLKSRSSDEPPLWKFYHEHDVTYWGKKEINGKEYPTYILFDNNMWTGETPTGNYNDINPRNNYSNNPNGNNDTHFINSKSDGGAYDEKMVSRVVQLSIDWDNHIIKDYKVYEISKKYSYTRSSVQMFDEGVLFISWADQDICGLFDFNDKHTIIESKLYKNGKMIFSAKPSSYRVHGYK